MSAFVAPLISGLITALIAGFSVYVTLEKKIAIIETKLDNLQTEVEKHNQVVERTFRLEEQIKTLFKQVQ